MQYIRQEVAFSYREAEIREIHIPIEKAEKGDTALGGRVLILNKGYEPVSICSAKKAMILLILMKAELVEQRNGNCIRSVRRNFPYPSVIRLSAYVHLPYKNIELSRKNLHRRDSFRCQYCGRKNIELTIDHIIPKSRGGSDSWENLITACVQCNNRKGNRTPEEANMPLLSRANKPHHILFMKQYLGNVEKEWKPFLFMD